MTTTKSNSVIKNTPDRRQHLKAAAVASLALVASMFFVGSAYAGVIYPLEIVNDNDYAIRIRVECNAWDCMDLPVPDTKLVIPAHGRATLPQIARKQGHGCDGHQGYFTLEVVALTSNPIRNYQSQRFETSNDGGMGKVGGELNYSSELNPNAEKGGWRWRIGSLRSN